MPKILPDQLFIHELEKQLADYFYRKRLEFYHENPNLADATEKIRIIPRTSKLNVYERRGKLERVHVFPINMEKALPLIISEMKGKNQKEMQKVAQDAAEKLIDEINKGSSIKEEELGPNKIISSTLDYGGRTKTL